ncbi:hypothetical protein CDAR_565581 [Caerostris darwini]|uniref:Uncharacterized protein n=1 Tax=Caerostris darwini TaxID=1538125 RepID=A0AAV4UYC5_9ARAC|nr:hypothetical protein CDAR_565581 [Caerostris darwini]
MRRWFRILFYGRHKFWPFPFADPLSINLGQEMSMRDNGLGQSEASPGQPRFESADFQEVPREIRFNLRKAMEDWDFLKVDDREFYLIFICFSTFFRGILFGFCR